MIAHQESKGREGSLKIITKTRDLTLKHIYVLKHDAKQTEQKYYQDITKIW